MDPSLGNMNTCVFRSDADINDHQSVNLLFNDGTQGIFTAVAMSGNPGRDITIHGTEGYLSGNLGDGTMNVQTYRDGKSEVVDLGLTNQHGGGDERIIAGFLNCIKTGVRPLASIEAGVRASLISFAADESIETKRPVAIAKL
jgi:predicted dehydrogenase